MKWWDNTSNCRVITTTDNSIVVIDIDSYNGEFYQGWYADDIRDGVVYGAGSDVRVKPIFTEVEPDTFEETSFELER